MNIKKMSAAVIAAVVTFGAGAAVLPQSVGGLAITASADIITDGDWKYYVPLYNDTDTVMITGYNGSDANLTIPSTLGGKTVTSIGDSAFEGCSSLTSVTIPDSVTSIYGSAFNDCSSLKKIEVGSQNKEFSSVDGLLFNKDRTELVRYPEGKKDTSYEIPDSVTGIGDDAFQGCSSLTSVTIPDGVTGIGFGAFDGCSSLTSVTIPDSVEGIGWPSFVGCSSLEKIEVGSQNENYSSVDGVLFNEDRTYLFRYPEGKKDTSYEIPDSVTGIGYYAFQGCSSLTSVTIPDSVTRISGDSAFSGCSALKKIEVGSQNESYSSVDGVLFNKERTELIRYPAVKEGTSYAIPDSVTRIYDHAFDGCSSLTSVTIPDSVRIIHNSIFYGCSALEKIEVGSQNENYSSVDGVLFNKDQTKLIWYPAGKEDTSYAIPDSVTSIGDYAFDGCSSLTSVTFNGTMAEWGAIKISDGNESLTNAEIICTDGTISGKPDESEDPDSTPSEPTNSDSTPNEPTNSDTTPSEPTNSDTTSSEPTTSDGTSSTPTTSNSTSSTPTTSDKENPGTGVAAVATGLAVLAGAAVLVARKKTK